MKGILLLGLDLSLETMIIIVGAIIGIIILVIVLILLLHRKKKKHVTTVEEKLKEVKLTPEQEVRQTIIEGETAKKSEEQLFFEEPKKSDFSMEERISKEQPIESVQPIQPAKPIQAQKSPEERNIERLVALLKPKRMQYTEKEIRQVLAEEGYSKSVMDEVIKRLGI